MVFPRNAEHFGIVGLRVVPQGHNPSNHWGFLLQTAVGQTWSKPDAVHSKTLVASFLKQKIPKAVQLSLRGLLPPDLLAQNFLFSLCDQRPAGRRFFGLLWGVFIFGVGGGGGKTTAGFSAVLTII